jgi:hypothetical protein
MKKLAQLCSVVTVALLVGCSSLSPSTPVTTACPTLPAEPAACPVCETAEQLDTQCPEPEVIEKIVEVPAPLPPMASTAGKMHLPIVGAVEWATVEPGDVRLQARMNTGTDMTTLQAEKVKMVEKDGKKYVRFLVTDPATAKQAEFESRLRRKVTVKQGEEESHYYIVKLWISIGKTRSQVEVALRNTDDPEYALSIGRNFLVDAAIVDVSRKNLLNK